MAQKLSATHVLEVIALGAEVINYISISGALLKIALVYTKTLINQPSRPPLSKITQHVD